MKIIIHDLEEQEFKKYLSNTKNFIEVSNNQPIYNCIGCFGCWVKTPAACVIKDHYGDMGELLSKCQELIVISRCFYGGYSPFVKNILDRSISYIHPYFEIRNGEMHHKSRYHIRLNLTVWFYGEDISESEKKTAEKLVLANGVNLNVGNSTIHFLNDLREMEGVSL